MSEKRKIEPEVFRHMKNQVAEKKAQKVILDGEIILLEYALEQFEPDLPDYEVYSITAHIKFE